MTFSQTFWLWGLVLLVPLYIVFFAEDRRRRNVLSRLAHADLLEKIIPGIKFKARLRKWNLWGIGAAFLFLSLAQPQWGSHEESITISGMDLVIALDVSNSMEVEDVVPNRLKKAKHFVRGLVEQLGGDRVGVIAFAGSAFMASPLTTDLAYVLEIIDTLTPQVIMNQGTDIGAALETATAALERGAQEGSEENTQAVASKAVVLISDGEDFEERAIEAAKKLKKIGAQLYLFGVGSTEGKPIPVRDESGNLRGYKRDVKGQPILSKFQPDALKKLAEAADGKFWPITSTEEEVNELLSDLGALNRSDYTEKRILVREERFQIPLAIALICFFIEMAIPISKVLVLIFFFFGISHTASAEPSLDVYLENKKGLEAYEKKDLDEARKRFGSAQAKDPASPELRFNQGVVQMEQKDYEGAAQSFSDSAKSYLNSPSGSNLGFTGRSFYNLGSSLAAQGQADKAIESFLKSIEAAKASGDEELEKRARQKLESVVQQQQQKQQQNQKQDQQNNQQQQDSQQQEQEQQSQNDKNEEQKEKQKEDQSQKRYTNKAPFKSQKLSKEDAERVMAELANREKQLQQKLNRQKGAVDARKNDW